MNRTTLAKKLSQAWQVDVAGAVLLLAVLGIAYLVSVQPIVSARSRAVTATAQLDMAQQRMRTSSAAARAVRSQMTSTREALSRTEIDLKPVKDLNARLARLTSLASECGVELQFVQPGSITSEKRFSQPPIGIGGGGAYLTCRQFLHQVHEKFPDMNVRSFDLATRDVQVGNQPPVLTISAEIVWFAQPQ